MLIEIDRTSSAPLYVQIHQQIREMILLGVLPAQTHLPPTRDLATALDVNRTTVVNAYRRLWGEGLIEGRSGGGTIVAPYDLSRPASSEAASLAWENLFTDRVSAAKGAPVGRRAMGDDDRGMITFAPEEASADVAGRYGLQQALAEPLLHEQGILERPAAQGALRLRKAIAEQLELDGIRATPSQVLVLTGVKQGMFVVAQALLERGDPVAVVSPTWPGALQTFRTVGARVHSIPTDEAGIRLDVAEGILRHLCPKLLFVEPTFQNPTGLTMALDHRQKLLELAYRYRIPIVEMDAHSFLRYDGRSVPSLKALDRRNHVLYLSTRTDVIPAVRVAWLVAPQRVAQQLMPLKESIGSSISGLGQSLLCSLFPWLTQHQSELVDAFRARRDAMCEALDEYCSGLVRWHTPEGGLFVWGELGSDLLAKPVLEDALRAGVSYVPGTQFYVEGRGGKRHVRLNFAVESEERIVQGLQRLGRTLRAADALRKTARDSAHRESGRALRTGRPRLSPALASSSLAWETARRLTS